MASLRSHITGKKNFPHYLPATLEYFIGMKLLAKLFCEIFLLGKKKAAANSKDKIRKIFST